VTELTVDAVIFVSRDSHETNRSSFVRDYGDTCKNVFQHHYTIGVKPTHPFVIACFEVFRCMVTSLQISVTFISFTEMGVGMGTVVCGDGWGWGQS